jgi:hypothetical protein
MCSSFHHLFMSKLSGVIDLLQRKIEDGESNQANHAKIGSVATGRKNSEEAPKTFRTTRRQECRVGTAGQGQASVSRRRGPGIAAHDDP